MMRDYLGYEFPLNVETLTVPQAVATQELDQYAVTQATEIASRTGKPLAMLTDYLRSEITPLLADHEGNVRRAVLEDAKGKLRQKIGALYTLDKAEV